MQKKHLVKQLLWFCWAIFCILTTFNKTYNFKNMSLRFYIKNSKHVHFWTLVFNTILILNNVPFQQYISCRHLNFDPTYKNGRHVHFSPFWKSGILGLVDHFEVCTNYFLEVLGPYKNVKQEFSLESKFLRILIKKENLLKEI